MKTVKISDEQFQELRAHSEISGRPIFHIIGEALSDYIETSISAEQETIAENAAHT